MKVHRNIELSFGTLAHFAYSSYSPMYLRIKFKEGARFWGTPCLWEKGTVQSRHYRMGEGLHRLCLLHNPFEFINNIGHYRIGLLL